MPFELLRYGLARKYPAQRFFPARAELRPSSDVVIIGGGGHGLATAYYLARDHGARSVAVLERGWPAGGNTARNTAIGLRQSRENSVRIRDLKQSEPEALPAEAHGQVHRSRVCRPGRDE